jgi:hypothetical protein
MPTQKQGPTSSACAVSSHELTQAARRNQSCTNQPKELKTWQVLPLPSPHPSKRPRTPVLDAQRAARARDEGTYRALGNTRVAQAKRAQ